jgi:hypothetical protein
VFLDFFLSPQSYRGHSAAKLQAENQAQRGKGTKEIEADSVNPTKGLPKKEGFAGW